LCFSWWSSFGVQRGLMSDAVEPTGQHITWPYRAGLAKQHKKNGLERVLRILLTEKTPAGTPDHWAMALDQGGEGSLVPAVEEVGQQFRVGQAGHRRLASMSHGLADLGHLDLHGHSLSLVICRTPVF
jgi:hypothetical protein